MLRELLDLMELCGLFDIDDSGNVIWDNVNPIMIPYEATGILSKIKIIQEEYQIADYHLALIISCNRLKVHIFEVTHDND